MHTERANAKINLYLDIVGRRENGYHDLVSLMQTISLCDIVSLEFFPAAHTRIHLQTSGNSAMPCDCRNLAWRAAERYLARIGLQGEVHIFLEKHIPMAAGLAGGSADAAAVLRGLNRLCGARLSVSELCALGAELGADIPFCIVGGTALVSGIGDRLQPLAPMPAVTLVVACQGQGVSTPQAYAALDAQHQNFTDRSGRELQFEPFLQALTDGNVLSAAPLCYNIFEEVVPQEQPFVERLKDAMLAGGATRAMMSGSGPSVFGIFAKVEDAAAVCERLRASGADAFVCHPCGKYCDL